LNYHVIDSEWRENYITPKELEALLTLSETLNPSLKTMVTVSTRHFGSMGRIKNLIEVMKTQGNAGLNLVAGNKVYLTQREQRRSASKTLINAVKFVRKRLRDSPVFVGTEGLVKVVSELVGEYNVTPFLLLDRNLEANVSQIREVNHGCRIAVYTPYLIASKDNGSLAEIFDQLWKYALRRQWVTERVTKEGHDLEQIQILMKREQKNASQLLDEKLREILTSAIKKLSICGDEQEFSRAFQTFERLKINVIVGLPLREEEIQVRGFAEFIRQFK